MSFDQSNGLERAPKRLFHRPPPMPRRIAQDLREHVQPGVRLDNWWPGARRCRQSLAKNLLDARELALVPPFSANRSRLA